MRKKIRRSEGWENGELSGEFMERNTVERAKKTEMETKTKEKRSGQAQLVYVKGISHNIRTTWKWARRDTKSITIQIYLQLTSVAIVESNVEWSKTQSSHSDWLLELTAYVVLTDILPPTTTSTPPELSTWHWSHFPLVRGMDWFTSRLWLSFWMTKESDG